MKWITALVTLVNLLVVSGVLLGLAGRGLNTLSAALALICGIAFAVAAYLGSSDKAVRQEAANGQESPRNLGDLSLHLTLIKNFANGVAIWPDSPIYVFSKLRYPAGIDFFNSLLSLIHIDLL